jgi:hypothetical protein
MQMAINGPRQFLELSLYLETGLIIHLGTLLVFAVSSRP